jgi:Leucine Rich repeats (2 copies)
MVIFGPCRGFEVTQVANVVEIATVLGPTEETRAQFAKSWLGSSLGQTVVLVGLFLLYVLILVVLMLVAGQLGQMKKVYGVASVYIVLITPLAIIMAFNALPIALKARRERRLKRLTMTGGVAFEPGYFRLHPYGAGDAHRFKRNDGADVALLDWVRRADEALLYLSGPSGSGKSSLIAARLEPELRAEGWAIVSARLFGDPLRQILQAFAPDDNQPPTPDHVYAIIAATVATRCQTQQSPLLLIIDQFEEYLILGDAAKQEPLQALVKKLVSQRIEGLKLLLSLRSDYQALIFQQDLPPARSTLNWFQLAPYRRGDAEAFLQSAGKRMTPGALDALFKGLDQIEETRGLYRPISLNMVGLVLERMGQTLEGDPETLIQSYLKSALITGDTRDYVRPLLEVMISDAGTKVPLSGKELASKARLEDWQVSAAMADLESRGLVRPLHGAKGWEIAHDFLARLLGQMLGRVKAPLITRMRPYVAPVGLGLWMAVLGFGVQYGLVAYQTNLRDTLTRNGWEVTAVDGGRFRASFTSDLNADSENGCAKTLIERDLPYLIEINGLVRVDYKSCDVLRDVSVFKGLKSLTGLGIGRTGVNDLTPLQTRTELTSLDLDGTGVSNLAPLTALASLTTLKLSSTPVTNLTPLSALTSLTYLDLSYADRLSDLVPLSTLTSLTSLHLIGSDRVTNLGPLSALKSLKYLSFSFSSGVTDLAPLSALTSLTRLELLKVDGVKDFTPLSALTSLIRLNLSYNAGITDLKPLSSLKSLTSLDLINATGVTDLTPLRPLTSLSRLDLNGATGVTDLTALRYLQSLTSLDLNGTGVTDLTPLRDLQSLTNLDLSSTGVTDLTPLRNLQSLNSLDLSSTGVTDLTALRNLQSLTSLDLSGTGVIDLTPLRNLQSLTSLNLTNADRVKSLAPLKGRRIEVYGISEALLTTMR